MRVGTAMPFKHLIQPSLTIDKSTVLSCLHTFPKGTSFRASKLQAQLMDAAAGSTAPAA